MLITIYMAIKLEIKGPLFSVKLQFYGTVSPWCAVYVTDGKPDSFLFIDARAN